MDTQDAAKTMDEAAQAAQKISGVEDIPRAEPQKKNGNGKSVITLDKGVFMPKTFDDLWNMASLYYKASVAPRKNGFDSVEKVTAAVEYCSKQNLIFQAAVNQIAFIEERMTLFGDLPKAICQKSGELEYLKCELIDAEYATINRKNKNLDKEVFGAVAIIKRKGQEEQEYYFTKAQAQKAGLYNKGVWKAWDQIMMKRKAIGYALKFEMSDILMGVGIAEYDFDSAPDLGVPPRDVTAPSEKTVTKSYLENKFSDTDAVQASGSSGNLGRNPQEAAPTDQTKFDDELGGL